MIEGIKVPPEEGENSIKLGRKKTAFGGKGVRKQDERKKLFLDRGKVSCRRKQKTSGSKNRNTEHAETRARWSCALGHGGFTAKKNQKSTIKKGT